jgi:AcrR family transcriptional regulator
MAGERRGEDTRARIRAAAELLFAQRGYDATAVAEICAQAHVTKGGFYHHYHSKQELFLELLHRWLDSVAVSLQADLCQGENVPGAMRRMAGTLGQVLAAAGGKLPIFLEFWSKATREPLVWDATVAPYHQYRDYFSRLVQQGIAEGSLSPVDPQMAARTLVSLAIGLILQGLLDPKGDDWPRAAQESIAMFIEAMERK